MDHQRATKLLEKAAVFDAAEIDSGKAELLSNGSRFGSCARGIGRKEQHAPAADNFWIGGEDGSGQGVEAFHHSGPGRGFSDEVT